jgi:hypothetical protein
VPPGALKRFTLHHPTGAAPIFVDISVDMAVTRADARHRQGHDHYRVGKGLGGRFVPAEVIQGQADPEWGSLNRKTFEAVKHRFDTWARYDNSAAAPVLADAGNTAVDAMPEEEETS